MSDDALKQELLRLDVLLRRKQLWWEHPRNAAIILGVVVALIGALGGIVGFQLGSRPPPTIVVRLEQPLVVKEQ